MKRARELLDKNEDEDNDDEMGGQDKEEVEERTSDESIPGAPKVNGI